MDVCIPPLESKTFARFTKFQIIYTNEIILKLKFSPMDLKGLCRLQNMFEKDQEKEEETNSFCQLNKIFSNSEAAIMSNRTLTITEYV